MYRLLPSLIIDAAREQRDSGEFSAACVFIDLSGFSAVTDALLPFGNAGTEQLAAIVLQLFGTPVELIRQQGGFIAAFAGDAITAVFPDRDGAALERSLEVSRAIQAFVSAHREYRTPFGTFQFAAKIGLGVGTAAWRIASHEGRSAYLVAGSALEDAIAAEKQAQGGELVASSAATARLGPGVAGKARAEMLVIAPTAAGISVGELEALAPAADLMAIQQRFIPRSVLDQQVRGEFRQITALFANLGASDLSEAAAVLQIVLQLQAHYGGYLSYAGYDDKGFTLLLVWGAPLSEERDLLRGQLFALRLAEQARVRIGLTTSQAFAGFVGSQRRATYTVYGRGVNLAARLMTAAPWGEIWLDLNTAMLAGSFATVDPVGSRSFPGIADKQTVLVLRGIADSGLQDLFEHTPFVGRQSEMRQLEQVLQPLLAGDGAGMTVLYGEAGIGKSRLLHQVGLSMLPRGVQWRVCQADPVLQQSLYPLRMLLSALFAQAPRASALRNESANQERFNQILDDLLRRCPDAGLVARVEAQRWLLAAILGLSGAESPLERVPPPQRLPQLIQSLLTLFHLLCSLQPLVLVLEDIHLFDDDTLEAARQLVAYAGRERLALALLATARSDAPQSLVLQGFRPLVMALGTLPAAETAAFAAALLGGPLAPSLLASIHERTQGNPFFVEQTLLFLREQQALTRGPQGYEQTLDEAGIPGTIGAILVARLDRLAQQVKTVITTAAVLGREFEVQILAEMLQSLSLHEALQAAEHEAIVAQLSSLRYLFRHALMRDAAYGMQLQAQRRELHRAAALAFETIYRDAPQHHAATIAYHSDQAGLAQPAVHWYQRAIDYAIQMGLYRDAQTLILRCRRLLPDLPEVDRQRRDLQITLAEGSVVIATQGQASPQVKVIYDRAVTLCEYAGDAFQQAQAALGLCTFYFLRGLLATAEQLASQALAIAARLDDRQLQIQSHMMLGNIAFWTRRLPENLAHASRVLELYDDSERSLYASRFAQNPRITCLTCATWARWMAGDDALALAWADDALDWSERVDHSFTKAIAYQIAALLHFQRRDARLAARYAEQLVQTATELGFPLYRALGQCVLGWARAAQGDHRAGVALAEEGLTAWDAANAVLAQTLLTLAVAESYLIAGDLAAAEALLEREYQRISQSEDHCYRAELQRTYAIVLARRGADPAGAPGELLGSALDEAQAAGQLTFALRALISRAELGLAHDREQIRELAGRISLAPADRAAADAVINDQ